MIEETEVSGEIHRPATSLKDEAFRTFNDKLRIKNYELGTETFDPNGFPYFTTHSMMASWFVSHYMTKLLFLMRYIRPSHKTPYIQYHA